MYSSGTHHLFRANTSSIQMKRIICFTSTDDAFSYSTVTAVPQAVTMSILPLPPTVS